MLIRIILAQLLKFENTELISFQVSNLLQKYFFYLSFLLKFNLKKDLVK